MTMLDVLRKYKAVRISFNVWQLNGIGRRWKITVIRDPFYRDTEFRWKVDKQYFTKEKWAIKYLETLMQERNTGVRLINHPRQKVPDICGVNGAACRSPGKCDTALCRDCPVAEEFFAKRDGVTLKYMK